MNSSLQTNLNSVTKVGDKLETLLKGKEIFFYQATIKREEEGELQALHSLATEQVPTTTRRKLNMEVLEKNACSTCLHTGKKVRSHSREPRSCESAIGEPNLAVEERARRWRTGWERERSRWISNNPEPYFNSKVMSVCLSVLDLPKKTVMI